MSAIKPPPDPTMTPNQVTATAEQTLAWLEAILVSRDGRVELRAIGVQGEKGRTFSRIYDRTDLASLVDRAVALSDSDSDSDRAEAVYFTLNPVKPDVQRSATDKDILRRTLLLIDCDPKRDEAARQLAGDGGKLSTTDTEKAHAHRMAGEVAAYLARLGWPAPVRADSSNGHHLVFAIDLPNDDEARDLVEKVLKALAHRFDTAECSIDSTLRNASRVCKLYGTLSRKGTPTTERPHRASSVLEVPEHFGRNRVAREMLEAVAALAPRSREPAPGTPPPQKDRDRPAAGGRWSVEERAIVYLAKCPGGVSGNQGHNQTFKTACSIGPGFDLTADEAFRLLRTHWNSTCQPPWSDKDLRRKVDEAFSQETRRGWLLDDNAFPTPLTPLTLKGGRDPQDSGAYRVIGV